MSDKKRTGKANDKSHLSPVTARVNYHSFNATVRTIFLYTSAGAGNGVAVFDPYIQLDENAPMPPSPFSYSAIIQFRDYSALPLPAPSYEPATHRIRMYQDIKYLQEFIDTVRESKNLNVCYFETAEIIPSYNAMISGTG